MTASNEDGLIKITDETIKLLPKIYEDIAQPAAKEIGNVLGRSVKALLSPIRGFLWGWEKIEEAIEIGISKRIENIPDENLKIPKPEIAVPLLQAFTYTAQNEDLREMYLNLLANSMNNSKDQDVHPSFVEMIKQMDSLDAKLFNKLSNNLNYIPTINPTISLIDDNKFINGATPEWFLGWSIEHYNIFEVSTSLKRLSRLGIIELMYDRDIGLERYSELENSSILKEILNHYQTNNSHLNLVIKYTYSVCYINEFGKQFARCCI